MKKLTARRVRKLRRYIAENRCPLGPGLTHDWREEGVILDYMQWCPPLETIYVCSKCGETDM